MAPYKAQGGAYRRNKVDFEAFEETEYLAEYDDEDLAEGGQEYPVQKRSCCQRFWIEILYNSQMFGMALPLNFKGARYYSTCGGIILTLVLFLTYFGLVGYCLNYLWLHYQRQQGKMLEVIETPLDYRNLATLKETYQVVDVKKATDDSYPFSISIIDSNEKAQGQLCDHYN